ncbi:nuclease-related domain-containing protein [Tenuibacillus multivorans]|uniref:nuclease-related domain-containing protein n=1 Tax=Tenuibacillus multivorans TaxID=237069 RepID=UPI00116777B0|nr:nuclease-related domain-containing protein [Tenuibacillus multivorans]GEL76429.1 hypothetical protein TMU01_06640 [Tenuibacillus multivorans]
MVVKAFEIPIGLLICTALLNRLPKQSPYYSKVQNQKSAYYSGFYGEKTLQYHLNFSQQNRFSVVNGLRLYHLGKAFQIDSLIMNPRFFLLVEVKNMDGIISIDPVTGQMTRVKDGREDVFKDPISQVGTQSLLLQDWLME